MRFVAHSVVPTHPVPYMHLGYLSGAPRTIDSPKIAFAFVFMAIAIYTWKRSLGWGIAFLGLAVTVFSWAVIESNRDRAKALTMVRARNLLNSAIYLASEDGKDSIDMQYLRKVSEESRFPYTDIWHHTYRLSQRTAGRYIYYTLTSSGPDEKFNTQDDLSFESKTAWSIGER